MLYSFLTMQTTLRVRVVNLQVEVALGGVEHEK